MMYFLFTLIGLIIGILIRDIKCKVIEKTESFNFEEWKGGFNKGGTQFIESISMKEKFLKANNIDDILNE